MALANEKPVKKRNCKLKDDEPRSGMESLPRDIALDVLSRLPITSLMQSRFVNRAWNMLSYDPNLASMHLSRASKNNRCLIFHCDYPIRNQLSFVELSDLENGIVRKIQTPFFHVMPEFTVVGSCNGFLCFSDSLYKDSVCIYNPFTREYKELPKSRQFEDQEVVLGFGFHPVTNEYKVVKIIYYWNHYNEGPRYRRPSTRNYTGSEVYVCSLGNTNWRNVGKVPYWLERRASEALVNGRLHWLAQSPLGRGIRMHRIRSIVSFDLEDEQFREVPKPDCGALNRIHYHLVVLGGCLSAVVLYHRERFEIWVMGEYNVKESWIKKFVVQDHSPQFMKSQRLTPYRIWKNVLSQNSVRVICLLENGNVLIEYKGGVIVSHDPENGTLRKLMFEGMPDLFQSVVHVGSLNCINNPIHTSRKT
ncbi:F-box and associated interaction domains-containing protein [Actinidia rufa]|uniref:F-box and associated interaction domains-containing protein n=1 Tax=Actinidia rufa TaxID=165716 RepID=A0A7J0FGI9_9ERIC|nr:F-box and associated interaction domains-containing protein [Actinidia rufa]